VVDGAGHLVQLDQPVALAAILTDWLAVRVAAP
jgi:pimeloyl-ACP methyl ester carboxylesterase